MQNFVTFSISIRAFKLSNEPLVAAAEEDPPRRSNHWAKEYRTETLQRPTRQIERSRTLQMRKIRNKFEQHCFRKIESKRLQICELVIGLKIQKILALTLGCCRFSNNDPLGIQYVDY